MVEVSKFIELNKKLGKNDITHEEQEKHGLSFSVVVSDNNKTVLAVNGEETELSKYINKFGSDAKEINEIEAKNIYDTIIPIKSKSCPTCNGSGNINTPKFDKNKIISQVQNKKLFSQK